MDYNFFEHLDEWNYESCLKLAENVPDSEIEEMKEYLYKYHGYEYEEGLEGTEHKQAVIIDYIVEGFVDSVRDRNRGAFYKDMERYIRYCL